MKTSLFWGLMLAAVAAQGETDWARLNVAAREHAKTPIRAGVPGVRPFWNGHAKAFIHPPAFEFKEVEGTASYRFTLTAANTGRTGASPVHSWNASKPWLPIPADVWDSLKPGYYTVKVDGSGERTFYRAAVFQGPYPKGACGYREAARKVYVAVYNLPQVQGWKTSDDPPKGYDLYCYPAKIMGSMIRALVRYNTADALAIARKMADWLIAHSQPADAPLAHFPPTYWGDRRDVAVKNAGQNMLLYPAHAALAYLDLAEVLRRAAILVGTEPTIYFCPLTREKWYNMVMASDREKFIDEHRELFWYTPDARKRDMSDELLVETILNEGTLDDFRELKRILTPKRLAHVFFTAVGRKVGNYYPEIRNFFSLALKPYA